jgi:hypothetical protein
MRIELKMCLEVENQKKRLGNGLHKVDFGFGYKRDCDTEKAGMKSCDDFATTHQPELW